MRIPWSEAYPPEADRSDSPPQAESAIRRRRKIGLFTKPSTTVEGNPAAVNGNAHRSVLLVRIVLGLIPLAAGLYVIGIGQDTNWDLRNYHFYNPFAYLTGRMGYDVAVAHVATYYNPLLHIPFYYAVTALPP